MFILRDALPRGTAFAPVFSRGAGALRARSCLEEIDDDGDSWLSVALLRLCVWAGDSLGVVPELWATVRRDFWYAVYVKTHEDVLTLMAATRGATIGRNQDAKSSNP